MDKILIQEKGISDMVQKQVISALREIMGDPDAGLPLSNAAVSRLKKSVRSRKEGKTKNLTEVLNKYK